jgi:hypothetical protein
VIAAISITALVVISGLAIALVVQVGERITAERRANEYRLASQGSAHARDIARESASKAWAEASKAWAEHSAMSRALEVVKERLRVAEEELHHVAREQLAGATDSDVATVVARMLERRAETMRGTAPDRREPEPASVPAPGPEAVPDSAFHG